MAFADILGHDRITEVMKRSLRNGKIAHSYLFEGVQGSGRKKTAIQLAQALFCTEFTDDSCDKCSSCRKVLSANHPDIHFISPLPDKRDITIDQLRELQHDLSLRPYEAPRKVCIIDPAEKMNTNSANSLLKTLEEPPGNALIILLTENADMLLSTVRSRCQIFRFAPLSLENICSQLIKNGMTPENAALAAPLAGGSLHKVHELDNDELAQRSETILGHISRLNFNSIATIFDASEELSGNRDNTLEILDLMISFYRDAVHLGAGSKDIANSALRREIEIIANRTSFERNVEILEQISETRRAVMRNASPKLSLDRLFINMSAN